MPARRSFVNLLPHTEFEGSVWGKLLKWSLSTGRYLVILTEMVVIVAFLSRFKLDKDLSDLSDSLTGKKAILMAQAGFEKDFRNLQSRLVAAGQLSKTQLNAAQTVDQITSVVPEGLHLTNLSVQKAAISLSGVGSELAFQTFVSQLTTKRYFKNVTLASIAYDATQGIKFSLTATY